MPSALSRRHEPRTSRRGVAFLALGSALGVGDGSSWPVWIAPGTVFLTLGIVDPRGAKRNEDEVGDRSSLGEETAR